MPATLTRTASRGRRAVCWSSAMRASSSRWQSIAVPTLVVVGAEDHNFLAAADYMATRIPDARKVVIDGAGHAANVDRPREFNAAVREFLDGAD